MTENPLATAQRLFAQALDALRGVASAGSAGERVSVLTLCEGVGRQLDQVTVATVAGLDRDGVFTDRGYRSATQALADLLGWEHVEARRRVTAAEQVTPRVGLDGDALPDRPRTTPTPMSPAAPRRSVVSPAALPAQGGRKVGRHRCAGGSRPRANPCTTTCPVEVNVSPLPRSTKGAHVHLVERAAGRLVVAYSVAAYRFG